MYDFTLYSCTNLQSSARQLCVGDGEAPSSWGYPALQESKTIRAGHFRYFLNFFNNKKLFCLHFFQVNNLFLHQSYLKSPLPVKLTC